MKKIPSLLAIAAATLALTSPAAAADLKADSYKVMTTIKSDAQGPVLALRADTAARRLYVARQGVLEAIDMDSGSRAAKLAVPGAVSAIALAPDLNRGFAASASDNSVLVFDLKTLQLLKTVKSGGTEPAGIEYDPRTKRVFVSHRKGGTLGVLAADSGEVVGSVALGGKLRGVAADTRYGIYVADEERNGLHVVDARELKVKGLISTWPATKPTSLTVDDKERRIYTATASGRMVVIDPDIGQMVGYVPIGAGEGGIAAQFLPNRFVRLFVPTADGQLTVVANAKLTATVESTVKPEATPGTAVAVDGKSGKAFLANANEILVLSK
jgi:DNA-binding beta-propeller fold protein YncE